MPKAEPLNDAEAAEVRRLHSEGVGRNEITRRTGITNARVSRYTKENGLTFEGHNAPGLKKAQEKRQQSLREMREQMARNYAEIALDIQRRVKGEYTYYQETKNGDAMVKVTLPEAPMKDLRDGLAAAGFASKSHLELLDSLGEKGAEEEKAMLTLLQEQIKGQHAQNTAQDLDAVNAAIDTYAANHLGEKPE